VHLADGAVIVHFHYFVMLAVLALYEDVAVLALGVAYVVVQHGAMGSLTPEYVYGRDPGAGRPWPIAVVHGLFVLAAAAALMANWRAHAQVRLSDRRHRREAESYMEVAGVMHLLLDPAGRVRIANDMTCATLQRPRDEIVGADWFALAVPEEERAARRAGFEGLIASDAERTQFENCVLCADGSIRRVHWAIALIRDHRGQVTGALSTGTDTTERRAVEARLAREQRDLAGCAAWPRTSPRSTTRVRPWSSGWSVSSMARSAPSSSRRPATPSCAAPPRRTRRPWATGSSSGASRRPPWPRTSSAVRCSSATPTATTR
jgi:PAS domain S-box-containing protein